MDMMSYLMGRNSGSAKKGAKIEVVTELPETGEANVIYLVPKQTEDENNVFDEYIWINDDWELIGTTDVDLSGYQPLLTAGEGIDITNDTISSAMPVYLITDNSSSNPFVLENCNRGIYLFGTTESIYLKGTATAIAKNIFMYGGFIAITAEDTTIDPLSNSWKTMGYIYGAGYDSRNASANGTDFSISNTAIQVWQTNGGISITNSYKTQPIIDPRYSATIKGTHTYTVLPQSSVVPTSDNQLVNKKYVDDSIANKQDVLTAGNNITIENNVISSTGGTEEVPSYVLNMHTEHNGQWNLELDNIDKARIGEIFTDAYEKGYESINVLLKYKTTASVYAYQVLLIPLNRTNNSLTIQNKPMSYKLTSVFHAEENINYVDNTASLRFGLCLLYFYGSWTNNVFTVTTASYKTHTWELPTNIGVLTKTNTVSYTPTANYHPSTKLYSDTTPLTKAGLSPYSTRTTYQAGDYVYRSSTDLTIYKCNTADTTGTWDGSKWTQKTYMEYLSDTLVGGALNGSY